MKQRLNMLKANAEVARQTHAYRTEDASIRFTEDLVARMKSSGLTRSVLAEKIGSSPAYITKILRGDNNFTLDSMVKIAAALGCELTIGLQPIATTTTVTPARRSSVSYRHIPTIPSPVLNDKAPKE